MLLEHKNQRRGELTVRIQDASIDALTSAMANLPSGDEDLSGSRITAAANAVSTAGDIVNSSLVGSFASLMEAMNVMVDIGNEIAKVRRLGMLLCACFYMTLADTSLGEPRMECAECWIQGRRLHMI